MRELSFSDWKSAASMAVDLIKKGMTVDEQKKVIELIESTIDMKGTIIDLKEHIVKLREENARLKEEAKINTEMSHDGKVYWRVTGGEKEGPYCPGCWGDRKRQIHMTVDAHYYECPACKNKVMHTQFDTLNRIANRRFV